MAIIVTVALAPQGDARPESLQHLGTAVISNDLADTRATNGQIGSYSITLSTRGEHPKVWKRGRVTGFPRLRRGAWDLLYVALRELVGDRNP